MAYGIMLGFIPCWFPTFGMGPFFSAGLARVARANILAAFVGGMLGTPLWPALFFLNYKAGSFFFPAHINVSDISEVEYLDAANHTVESLQSGSLSFLTGAVVNIIISSLIIYVFVYFLYKNYGNNISK
jgi:uncharacterized protein